MSPSIPRARTAALGALLLAVLATVPAAAHEGDPRYRSTVRDVTPRTAGLRVEVLNYDDALQLTNRSHRTVEVLGYASEPYARILKDGTVQINERSPAVALNEDEHQRETPSRTATGGPPLWRTLDRTGRFEWHDHRIHLRTGGVPSQVHDRSQRTTVMNWRVPLRIDGHAGAIAGTLVWAGSAGTGSSGGFPTAAVVSLALLVLLALAAVVLVRRRRGAAPPAEPPR